MTPDRARCAWLLLVLGLASPARPQGLDDLSVGLWVRVKGELRAEGSFLATEIEVLVPVDEETLVGTPTDISSDGETFLLLGLPVHVSARTEWDGVRWEELPGRQVKVDGHYRGPRKFSAREIAARREPGRDRVEGRLDGLCPVPGGLELRVLHLVVFVPASTAVRSDEDPRTWRTAPERAAAVRRQGREDDDEVLGTVALSEELTFGGQLEWRQERSAEEDLDGDARGDEREWGASLQGELVWEPSADVYAVLAGRLRHRVEREEADDTVRGFDGALSEAFVYLRDPFGGGVDLALGRQDFDEPREWLWDENLDALRLVWRRPGLRLDLAASTLLADGSRANKDSTNLSAYLSNDDDRRHLAFWALDRRHRDAGLDEPFHAGLRALGEWLPQQKSWAELALVRGGRHDEDFRGWGLDVGTTWFPPTLEPLFLTLGFARGSGDDDPDDGVDHAFRQTGLHDNNGKLGGVTSFRYYGEVLDPELSNLSILTAGIGVRPTPRSSIDLVGHTYEQVEASDRLRDSNLETRPDGLHEELGWGLDLVLGSREWEPWDLEVVLGKFFPGAAFPDGEDAWVAKVQVRFRF